MERSIVGEWRSLKVLDCDVVVEEIWRIENDGKYSSTHRWSREERVLDEWMLEGEWKLASNELTMYLQRSVRRSSIDPTFDHDRSYSDPTLNTITVQWFTADEWGISDDRRYTRVGT